VGCAEGACKVVLEDTAARRRRPRLEHSPDAAIWVTAAKRRQRFIHGGWVMGKVMPHRYAIRRAAHLQPALDALLPPHSVRQISWRYPEIAPNRNCGEGISHVVHAEQRRGKTAERFTAPAHLEVRQAVCRFDVGGLPCRVLGCAERFERTDRVLSQS